MKINLVLAIIALCTSPLLGADLGSKEDITSAAKKLGEAPSYSWKATVVVPESAQFKPGPTEGKTEKGGFTHVTMSFGDELTEAIIKGDKAVVTDEEGEWQAAAELENAEGRGRFLGRMVRNVKTPAEQAVELATAAKELKKEGEVYSGELSPEGAKAQFRFGTPKDPEGSVKFWLKDGTLSKYELKVKAKVEFNGNEMEIDRATTVEIKDVGTTKVNVPEAAKKKMT